MIKSKDHTVVEKKLQNGAAGLFIHVPGATVMHFEFNFRAGYYLMDPDKWETPHIMEHLSLGANDRYPKASMFDAELTKNGAYSNAHTDNYHVWYDAECADFEWDRILDLITLSFSKPKFLQSEFKAECGNVRDELVGYNNNNGRILSIAMYEEFGVLSMSDTKRIKLMKNVTLNDVVMHHKRTHTSSNMRFIIAGNLKGRMKHIEEVLSRIDLPKGRGRFGLPDEIPTKPNAPIYVQRKSVDNVYFDIATFQKKLFVDEDWSAASVVNTLLTETFHSKIFGKAREKGLVYNMGSGFGKYLNYVDWSIGGQAQQKNLPALADIIVRELKKLIAGKLSDEDIEAAKQYCLGSFQLGAQTVGGVISGYRHRYFFDDKLFDYFGIPERISKVKKQKVIELVKGLFEEGTWGLGMLGTADEELRKLIEDKISVLWKN